MSTNRDDQTTKSAGQLPATIQTSHLPAPTKAATPSSGSILDTAFNRLPAEQQQALLQKAVEEKLGLDVEAARANQRHSDSAEEMHQYIHQAKSYNAHGHDFVLTQQGKTHSGGWQAQISKRSYTLYIVIAIVTGIALAFIFGR